MKKETIFKSLIDNAPQEIKAKLISYLSKDEIVKLEKIKNASFQIKAKDFYQDGLIDTVHYSWFIPVINLYSKQENLLFLLAMKKNSQNSLKKILEIDTSQDKLNPIAKDFLRDLLYQSLIKKDDPILPIEYLPRSDMNNLLKFSKKEIVKIIDLLSMYDLAKELKKIVETKKLKLIYSYLSKDEKEFLNSILKYNEPFTTKKMQIENYILDKKSFKNILHKRGLLRLSSALSLENIDLIWYVCHYLDIGRGSLIFKESKNKKREKIAPVIREQVINIIKQLKK